VPKPRTAAFGLTCCISASLLVSCARHYRVEGLVLRVDPAQQRVLVSHRDIPGYMKSMVMPFRVQRAEELAGLTPGVRVNFDLVVRRTDSFVRRMRKQGSEDIDNLRLPQPEEKLAIGAPMPDFALIDQSARTVRLSDFRGKVVAVDFIYTRCPLPDVCPRLSATFAALQRRFAARMNTDLALLSVTIDPQYDTPGVLAGYAKIWRADPTAWRFLTGTIEEVQNVAKRFGLIYWPEEGLMTHTLATGIIARDGRLAAVVEGSTFTATQLGDLIEAICDSPRS
jgi:protein SCO1/2